MSAALPAFALSALLGLLLVPLSFPLARRWGLVAAPGAHRRHEGQVPLSGGIAMGLSAMLAVVALGISAGSGLALGLLLLLAVGILDDRFALPYWVRFVFQIGAMLSMMWLDGVRLVDLGHVFSTELAGLGAWSAFLTVFAGVGVINAINMVDGMDGLSGGLAMVCLVAGAWLLDQAGASGMALILVTAGALTGFLAYNMRLPGCPKARVFMGDAGSMMLGLVLAWMLIGHSQGAGAAFPPVVALWLLALPLYDAVGVLLRRPLNGGSPFDADWRHTHHLLQRLGFGVNATLAAMVGIAALLAVIGIAGWRLGIAEHHLFYGFMGLFGLYLVLMEWGERRAPPEERA